MTTKREAMLRGYLDRQEGRPRTIYPRSILLPWWRIGWDLAEADARAGRGWDAEAAIEEILGFPHDGNAGELKVRRP